VSVGVGALIFIIAIAGGDESQGDAGRDRPDLQEEFTRIVQDGQEAAEGGNEVAAHKAHEVRTEAMCDALPDDLRISDWIGEVDEIDTTTGGDSGVLDVQIADGINVTTWNNSMSDSGDHTLIDPESSLYDTLAELEEGDEITFSGTFIASESDCLHEQSLFETNSMEHPAFVFRFASVDPR
jgi:hypothetical protein